MFWILNKLKSKWRKDKSLKLNKQINNWLLIFRNFIRKKTERILRKIVKFKQINKWKF